MIFLEKKRQDLRSLSSWKDPLNWLILMIGVLFLGAGTAQAKYGASARPVDLPTETLTCPGGDRNLCAATFRRVTGLRLPDLVTLPPFDFRLVEYRGSGKREIHFANSVLNRGEGVLELRGELDHQNNSIVFHQRLVGDGEQEVTHRVGEFNYHPEHGHWHWDDFSVYEIWALAPDGRPAEVVVTSGKVGYCMLDIRRLEDEEIEDSAIRKSQIPETRQYRGCGWRLQGISVGWVDTYHAHTPGQSMDVSELRDGIYAFLSTVDPEGYLYEADRGNNTAMVYFSLYGDQFRLIGETLSSSCQRLHHSGPSLNSPNSTCK